MSPMKTWLLRGLAALVALGLVAWLARHTTWEQKTVHLPPHGEAVRDPYYLLRPIVEAAGSALHARASLEPLPPDGATLLLASISWDVFPDRDARLKDWVARGGHLVLPGSDLGEGRSLRWLPVAESFEGHRKKRKTSAASAPFGRLLRRQATNDDDSGCESYRTVASASSAPEPATRWFGCGFGTTSDFRATSGHAARWALVHAASAAASDDEDDDDALHEDLAIRVDFGRGDVTVVSGDLPYEVTPLGNPPLLQHDTALAVAAILDLRPGRPLWVVEDEAREDIASWLWHRARAPLLLAVAAVALALWRLVPRFGPPAAPLDAPRRSMGEQVRGIGQFLASREPGALHAATRAALEDAARRHVDGWQALDTPARIAALARRAHVDPAALASAWQPETRATATQWLGAVAVLERARRALQHIPATV